MTNVLRRSRNILLLSGLFFFYCKAQDTLIVSLTSGEMVHATLIEVKPEFLTLWIFQTTQGNVQPYPQSVPRALIHRIESNSGSDLTDYYVAKMKFALPQVRNGSRDFVKDPTLAGILSFLTPGLGQLYADDDGGALLFFFGAVTAYGFYIGSIKTTQTPTGPEVTHEPTWLIVGIGIHIWSIIDAPSSADHHNEMLACSINSRGFELAYHISF